MTLDDFLSALARDGVARVAPGGEELEGGERLPERLAELHRRAALELAGDAPALDLDAARDGARLLHHLAQGVLEGRAPGDELAQRSAWTLPGELAVPRPPTTPAAAFSADLALRWLADLDRLALGLPDLDPRRASLRAVGRTYPLSSVGVRGLSTVEPGVLLEHLGLARLYVDRVLASGADERLTHPLLARLAREAGSRPGVTAGTSRGGAA